MNKIKTSDANEPRIIGNVGTRFYDSDFIEYSECPVCCSTDRIVVATQRRYRIRYLLCNNCYAVSTSLYLKNDAIKRNYKDFRTKEERKGSLTSGLRKNKKAINDWEKSFAKHVTSFLNFDNKNIRILDYGGSSGSISYSIALNLLSMQTVNTVDILVVDIDNDKKEVSTDSRVTINKVTSEIFNGGQFDFIIANQVLEHIPFPGSCIVDLIARLKINGFIFIGTPYLIPLYKFLFKFGIEINIGFPDHFHDFSKKFYESLTNTLNLKNLEIVTSQTTFNMFSFKMAFFRAILSRIMKFPYLLNKNYPFVGGWEIIYKRNKGNGC
jgi:2-polyprenyl-3-methyl-5-hydroxy-6-metoxy-1,4-benzoquinol methylase